MANIFSPHGVEVEDEGTPVSGSPLKQTVNFVGAGVHAATDGTDPTKVNVTITGGGGGGGVNSVNSGTGISVDNTDASNPIVNASFGTTSTTVTVGNDARLSNDRTASGIRTATTVVSVSGATAPTSGQVLQASNGTTAAWVTLSSSGITGSGAATQLAYFDSTSSITGDAGMVWDGTTLNLGANSLIFDTGQGRIDGFTNGLNIGTNGSTIHLGSVSTSNQLSGDWDILSTQLAFYNKLLFVAGSVLTDQSAKNSLLVNERQLVAPDGTSVLADWAALTNSVELKGIDGIGASGMAIMNQSSGTLTIGNNTVITFFQQGHVGVSVGSPNYDFAAPTVNAQTLRLSDVTSDGANADNVISMAGGDGASLSASGEGKIKFSQGTNQFQASINGAAWIDFGGASAGLVNNVQASDGAGGFLASGVFALGGVIQDASSIDVLNITTRAFYDTTGTLSQNTNSRIAYDSSAVASLNWDTRRAIDSANNLAIDYELRHLLAFDATQNMAFDVPDTLTLGTTNPYTIVVSGTSLSTNADAVNITALSGDITLTSSGYVIAANALQAPNGIVDGSGLAAFQPAARLLNFAGGGATAIDFSVDNVISMPISTLQFTAGAASITSVDAMHIVWPSTGGDPGGSLLCGGSGIHTAGPADLFVDGDGQLYLRALSGSGWIELTGGLGTVGNTFIDGSHVNSMDFNARQALDSTGAVAIDWSAAGKVTVTGVLDPYGLRMSAPSGNDVWIELTDGAGAAVSASNEARLVYNNGAGQVQVSVNGGAYAPLATNSVGALHDVQVADGSGGFTNAGGGLAWNGTNLTLAGDSIIGWGNGITVKGQSDGQLLIAATTNETSLSGYDVAVSATGAGGTVYLNGNVRLSAGIQDSSGSEVLDAQARVLYDSSNKHSIDFEDRLLADASEITSVNYNDRIAYDSNSNQLISWNDNFGGDGGGGALRGGSPTTILLQWDNTLGVQINTSHVKGSLKVFDAEAQTLISLVNPGVAMVDWSGSFGGTGDTVVLQNITLNPTKVIQDQSSVTVMDPNSRTINGGVAGGIVADFSNDNQLALTSTGTLSYGAGPGTLPAVSSDGSGNLTTTLGPTGVWAVTANSITMDYNGTFMHIPVTGLELAPASYLGFGSPAANNPNINADGAGAFVISDGVANAFVINGVTPTRSILNGAGVLVADFQQQGLVDPGNPTNVTVQWAAGNTTLNRTGPGDTSIQWGTGQNRLVWTDGIKDVLNWGTLQVRGAWAYQASVITVTADYTVLDTDYTVLVDATAGATIIDLPSAATVSGQIYNVKKVDISVNGVAVHTADLIDGSVNQLLSVQYSSIQVQSDGTTWSILSKV